MERERVESFGTHPDVAWMSTSGHEGLRLQNASGGLSFGETFLLKEPCRLGEIGPPPVAGCTERPEPEVQSRVRLLVERNGAWVVGVTVPGGGTTLKIKQKIKIFLKRTLGGVRLSSWRMLAHF